MASTPEVKVKNKIEAALMSLGAVKIIKPIGTSMSAQGVSDMLVCYYGLFFAIEAKSKGNMPTQMQRKFLHDVLRSGGAVAVVDESNVDGLAQWMQNVADDADHPTTYLHKPNALEIKIKKVEL